MHTPLTLTQLDATTLAITWDDRHESRYVVRDLRLACRCAVCVDEITGERRLRDDSVPDAVRPQAIRPVGNYALHISWSDGHSTGFFRFDYLRGLCKCGECPAQQMLHPGVATRAPNVTPDSSSS